MNMLWYAAYGSNVNRDRFLEYIHGGSSRFHKAVHAGCRNKSDPIRDFALVIERELYFARNSEGWGGAVAFVRTQPSQSKTLARAYLISQDQFEDIACQENGKRPGDRTMKLDYEYAEKNPECYLNSAHPSRSGSQNAMWYGRVLMLGKRESWPIFTLTAEWDGYVGVNPPGRPYVKCMADGIRQLSRISHQQLVEYFINKVGIKERISRPVLERWLS